MSDRMIYVSDIVEPNGKTIKQNNMDIQHKIPIGTLVEVYWEGGEYNGVRLFVVEHVRDCDGTPLYNLSFDLEVVDEIVELNRTMLYDKLNHLNYAATMFMRDRKQGSMLTHISESSLTIVEEKQ
jgi:hypothetical protein